MPDVTQPTDITTLLRRWRSGDSHAYDLVMSWAYQRMLAIAAGFAAQEKMPTEPASLVNEAYIRLRRYRTCSGTIAIIFFGGSRGAAPHPGGSGPASRGAEARGQPAPHSDVG
ncbi:MAG: ECF-type sigma factor [Bryobacteraceae bacterium]